MPPRQRRRRAWKEKQRIEELARRQFAPTAGQNPRADEALTWTRDLDCPGFSRGKTKLSTQLNLCGDASARPLTGENRDSNRRLEQMKMPDNEDQDLRDIQAEETTRGKQQPKKALSLKFQRLIAQAARMLRDPRCDRETYLEVIREFELPEDSEEFRQLLALWRKRRGND
jgi:hypothetical protein